MHSTKLTRGLLVSDVVGVLLLTVSRRLLLVGVEAGHFDVTSAEEASVLVEACGDVCTGPLTVDGVMSGCRV